MRKGLVLLVFVAGCDLYVDGGPPEAWRVELDHAEVVVAGCSPPAAIAWTVEGLDTDEPVVTDGDVVCNRLVRTFADDGWLLTCGLVDDVGVTEIEVVVPDEAAPTAHTWRRGSACVDRYDATVAEL